MPYYIIWKMIDTTIGLTTFWAANEAAAREMWAHKYPDREIVHLGLKPTGPVPNEAWVQPQE